MELVEYVDSKQTRFLHLINKLSNLGKYFSNKYRANKILRCICRGWKPKVTTIKESNDLISLNITKLFEKLAGHENELKRIMNSEANSKKKEEKKGREKWSFFESLVI